ncbi:MAG: hypothetical protein ACRCY8_18705 [Dermatophilaceae bacterium]
MNQTLVSVENDPLIVTSIDDGSCIAALTARTCDIGQVGFETGMVVDRVGVASAPQSRFDVDETTPR